MNRYEHANVKHLIDGYMVGARPHESREQEFERAKAELLVNLRRQIERVEGFSYADMCQKTA